jgi:RHS repeat-associated protein
MNKVYHTFSRLSISFLLLLVSVSAFSQSLDYTMSGPLSVSVDATVTYSVTLYVDDTWINPYWTVSSNGTIVSSTFNSTTRVGSVTIHWTGAGIGTVSLYNYNSYLEAQSSVSVNCNPTLTAPTSATPGEILSAGFVSFTVAEPVCSGCSIQWYNNAEASGTALGTGNSYTVNVTVPVTYYARTVNTQGCWSSTTPVSVTIQGVLTASNIRSVVTEAIRKREKNEANLPSLTDAQRNTTLTYLDGLGRSSQHIELKGSPDNGAGAFDMVQVMQYDIQGRATKNYLTYTSTANDGTYHSSAVTEQASFYTATNDKIANDNYPFSQIVYENSPLGRTKEQGIPGTEFQPGGHTQKLSYSYNTGGTANDLEEVRKFNVDGSSTGFYAANILDRIEATDADGFKEVTFVDERGLTIARKKQLDETIGGSTVAWLQTYYIYDDFHRLQYIISPKGQAALKANGWVLSSAILNSYGHQFVYDYRGRIVQKKAPGQAWMYYAYDKLNRLVLAQDGNLRATNKWAFVKYDNEGRAIIQGLYKNATQTTRQAIQALVDGLYIAGNTTYPDNAWYETRGTALHGYTNTSFPKTNADATALEILSVNYYDNYDFDLNGTDDYAYTAQGLAGEIAQPPLTTMSFATGSKRLVLGTTTWLYSYIFYDRYDHIVQVRTNNHLSTSVDNLITKVYDEEGKVTISKTYHNAGSGRTTTIVNKYTYDTKGRLLKVYQNNNGAASDQLVVQYTYNALGQVVDKKLHETSTGSNTFLQSVDMRYNIRGQLASINNAGLNNDGGATNDEANDYFGMEFLYQGADASLGNAVKYDGSISAVKWKSIGSGSGTADQRSYKYSYDKSGKLKAATSQVYSGTAWNKESNTLNESMAYDRNGNIVTLQRNQRKYNTPATPYINDAIDNLTYTYSSAIGDQLLKVEDAAATTGGFTNGANVATEYTYDAAGNIVTDQNKKISNVIYNILGKPTSILFTDNRKIEYTYDAAGSKLSMKTYAAGGTLQLTTDYVGGFVYENNILSMYSAPEGRVVNNNGTDEYQYAIADHQGNTRLVFSSLTPAASAPTANFEGDSNDGASQYLNVNAANVVPFGNANHTTGGSKVVRMNQAYKTGPARSIHVYPGDQVDIEVWEYHEGTSGFGTTSTPLATLITNVAAAFGGVSGAAGESGAIYNGVNSAVTAFGTGGNRGDSQPAAYLNYIVFDKNYNVLDAGWQLAPATTFTKQKLSFPTKLIKEEGYVYTWLSYDDDSNNFAYFDDFKVTHTKTNVIQYNEYYPFGLQASTSWTRENSKNNFLYNDGSELNTTSGWYETFFRGYDATLGRFMQIDPRAAETHTMSPYQYANGNPALFNDPYGDMVPTTKEDWDAWDAFTASGYGGTFEMWASDRKASGKWYNYTANGGSNNGGTTGGGGYSTSNQNIIQRIIDAVLSNNLYIANDYFRLPNYEVISIIGNVVNLRELEATWVSFEESAQQGAKENGVFFQNETAAYKFMYNTSKGYVELAAYVLEGGGVEILPWKYNSVGHSYASPWKPTKENRVKEVVFNKGRPIIKYNDGTERRAVAYIHSHPAGVQMSDDDIDNLNIIKVPNYTLSSSDYLKDTYWGYNGKYFGFLQVNGRAIQNTQIIGGFSIYKHAISIINGK